MPHLKAAIEAFPPQALRDWSEALGQETFVGSSGRVFPKAFKASPLLRAWLRRLDALGVKLALRHRWTGWDEQGRLRFQTPDGPQAIETQRDRAGARRRKLAAAGLRWCVGRKLAAKGVKISPLRPANSGFTVAWSEIFRDRFEGQPLKGVALTFGAHTRPRRSHRYPHRHRRRRDLRAVGGIARGDLRDRAGNAAHCPASRSRDRKRTDRRNCRRQRASNPCRISCARPANLSPVAIGLLQEAAKTSGNVACHRCRRPISPA